MEKEKLYRDNFTTKKSLILRLFNFIENGQYILRIIYRLKENETAHYDFIFNNDELINETFNELIDNLNSIEENQFFNFGVYINNKKMEFNKLIG